MSPTFCCPQNFGVISLPTAGETFILADRCLIHDSQGVSAITAIQPIWRYIYPRNRGEMAQFLAMQ